MMVSVIIPTCNSNFTLRLAVLSALSQINTSDEIIIANDGTRPLSKYFENLDSRIIVREDFPRSIEELNFPSGGYARNKGIEIANGKYIAFLDDDDQFEPAKLKTQLQIMEAHSYGCSSTNAYISIFPFRNLGRRTTHSKYYTHELENKLAELNIKAMPDFFDERHLMTHNFIITSSVVCDRSILLSLGGFDNIATHGQLRNGSLVFEDWDLWQRISKLIPIKYIDLPLTHYKRGSIKKLYKKLIASLINFRKLNGLSGK